MTRRDEYYNRAKQEGYRTRAAYKLKQMNDEGGLLAPGDTVVDLGAAPGGWLQVAAEAVGPSGTVVGVDYRRIDDLDAEASVTTVRGDMTEAETVDRLRDLVGEGGADAVLSDMSPDITGQNELDHARSVHLVRQALSTATDLLAPDGDFVAKVFDGPDLADLTADVGAEFQYVREVRPPASRDESSELYLVAKGRTTAPVAAGDELDVEVVDVGSQGDGVAKVDGFTLFVPGASAGETVRVRVTDVKPRFGFAEAIDPDAESE
jgi:23S rRNA (uridine2552-2'-O)-methyltransferase